ncbi:MAG: hypothetical protein IIA87_02630, partial [Nanoarchaeota archaeon]|nr:hypothetical protein [Nanoarchaeota archaeon]
PELVSTGITNLSINTEIRNNSAFANSTALSALNVTANITFYGMPGTFTDPVILINGTSICDTTTSPACSNFTSLNAATVIFNVSFWDVLNYTIGERPDGNNAPQITHVYNDTTQLASGVTLNEGPSSTTLVINFSVNDAEGIGDLDNSTATLNITRSGEPVRFNNTCSQISSQASGNNANYSCEVIVYWFDLDGEWLINASIKDSAGEFANNNTEVFNINSLTAFVSGPGNLTFGGINTGDINVTSTNDPLLINNTGNQDFADGSIEINATDLIGEENPAFALWSGNFSVGNVSDGSNAECNFGGSGGDSAPNATRMNFTHAGGNFVTIKLANLSRGNFSVNDGQTGQEELFICLLQVGSEISAQPYSTASQGAWTIRILWIGPLLKILFLEGIGSGILLAAVITRKKKRKSIRDDKLDKAVKALTLLIDELRDKYGLSKKETLDLVIKELAEKYKIGKKELIEVLELRIKENIPSTIFSKKLGGLEAIVKYMKENLGMSYSEIAKQLVRDDRTIWTSYKKATEKQPEALEVKETSTFFPIEIFKDRNLTVLESIVVYLKEKGLRYSEIAKLLDRDQRNIQTIYSRAIKKLHKGE